MAAPRIPPRLPDPPEGRAWDDARLGIATECARVGLSDDDIAAVCHVPRSCINVRHVRDAIDRARAATGQQVAAALLKKALAGNVAAQIFWLKARHLWREADASAEEDKMLRRPRILIIE